MIISKVVTFSFHLFPKGNLELCGGKPWKTAKELHAVYVGKTSRLFKVRRKEHESNVRYYPVSISGIRVRYPRFPPYLSDIFNFPRICNKTAKNNIRSINIISRQTLARLHGWAKFVSPSNLSALFQSLGLLRDGFNPSLGFYKSGWISRYSRWWSVRLRFTRLGEMAKKCDFKIYDCIEQ